MGKVVPLEQNYNEPETLRSQCPSSSLAIADSGARNPTGDCGSCRRKAKFLAFGTHFQALR